MLKCFGLKSDWSETSRSQMVFVALYGADINEQALLPHIYLWRTFPKCNTELLNKYP